jgi:D-3-phosphoglycerate dehydrogenase
VPVADDRLPDGEVGNMADPVESLILVLLEWIGAGSRPYADVIDAWRTSCPRLTVWEEANSRGFIAHSHRPGQRARVSVSEAGVAHLRAHRNAGAFAASAVLAP